MASSLRESIDVVVKNRNLVVGLAAVQVNTFEFEFIKGILLRAPGTLDAVSNTDVIYLGSPIVTADTDLETGGFPLTPGSSLFLPVEFATGLYAISTAADQKLAWLGV